MTLCRASVSWASKKVHSGRRDAFSIIPIMINDWDIVVTVGASDMSIHSKCAYKRRYNEEMKKNIVAMITAGAMAVSMVSALPSFADESAASSTAVVEGETAETGEAPKEEDKNSRKEEIRAQYGENKQITDDNYDRSLAVKCINGTFVGKKTDNTIAYKGIPFVGEQPMGENRWKAPVDYTADDGVYEAYYSKRH